MDTFDEYANKRFGPGDRVVVHSLGLSMPGEFFATVCGIHAFEPFEDYIVEWEDKELINSFYKEKKKWTHSVITKACLRAA